MPFHCAPGRQRLAALVTSAVAAAVLSTAFQIGLWRVFTDAWPVMLFRDARLAAAIVMGPQVLPPPATFDFTVMAAATAIHLGLSFVYAVLVAALVEGRTAVMSLALGAAFGLVLYAVNMHVFTTVFPWFVQARDWITVAAHVAFGVVAALAWHVAAPRGKWQHGQGGSGLPH